MTDTEATAQAQEEYRRVLEQARGWSVSYLAATLTDSSAPPSHLLAARHEAARRLRARQREGGVPTATTERTELRKAIDRVLRDVDGHTFSEAKEEVKHLVENSFQVLIESAPQQEGEREPDWPTVMDYITDLQAAVVQLQLEVGMLDDEPPADTEQGGDNA